MTVNESLKHCRKSKGFSQNMLAEKMGVSKVFISTLENGNRQIPVNRLIQIANILNCSLDELVGRERKEVIL